MILCPIGDHCMQDNVDLSAKVMLLIDMGEIGPQ